jgi:hypothetical protein
MSRVNVEVVRRFWEAFNRREWVSAPESWEAVILRFRPDFAFFNNALRTGGRGRSEWEAYARRHLETMPDVQVQEFDHIDAGDIVISLTTIVGTDRGRGLLRTLAATGRRTSWRTCSIWRFDGDGRVIAAEGFEDMLKPLLELGHVSLPIELAGLPPVVHRYAGSE